MLTPTLHHYSHWTRQRIGEMDAAIASLRHNAKRFPAGRKTSQLIARLERRRDRFEVLARKLTAKNDTAMKRSKARLHSQWLAFEAMVSAHIGNAEKRLGLHKSVFGRLAAAQSKAWQDAERGLHALLRKVLPRRRRSLSTVIKGINTKRMVAKKRAEKVRKSVKSSWAAMRSTLNVSRKDFDRANRRAAQAIRKALS